MPRPVHFEIFADDPERATSFYETVFGWQIKKWEGPQDYWLITTGEKEEPGIDGGLAKNQHPGAAKTTNTIGVDSVDDFTTKVTDAGGTIIMPKMAIPGIGYLAYCTDTVGNDFGLMEADSSAK
jgi:uncharacterized protein